MTDVLPDYLAPDLRAIFCGTAVATASQDRGGYYAGRGNRFWEYLAQAGLTAEQLGPDSDHRILEFRLGLTDLVKDRASSSDTRLSGFDVPRFVRKVRDCRPGWIAFHGKTAAKIVAAATGNGSRVRLGRQAWDVAGIRVFVLPSASAANQDSSRLEGMPTRLSWFNALAKELARDEPGVSDG